MREDVLIEHDVGLVLWSHYLRGCVGACVSVSAIRPHAFVFVLVFLLFDNLMLEFFYQKYLNQILYSFDLKTNIRNIFKVSKFE